MEQEKYAQARTVQRTWSEELMDKGERKGQESMRQAVATIAELLGIELTTERSEQVARMDLSQLNALCAHLKTRRSWPQG